MSHTEEPWSIDEYGRVKADGCNEFLGVQVDGFSLNGGEESKANARRIVACVNACEGINTDTLETEFKHLGAEYVEVVGLLEFSDKSLSDTKAERDTYRDLCAELIKDIDYAILAINNGFGSTQLLRDAITKAESILGDKNGN